MPFDQAGFGRKLSAYDRRCLAVFKQTYAKLAEGPHQWCSGRLEDHQTGARCAVGWLRFYSSSRRAHRMVMQHMTPIMHPFGVSYVRSDGLMSFNDTRGFHDVLDLFSRTIDRLEFG